MPISDRPWTVISEGGLADDAGCTADTLRQVFTQPQAMAEVQAILDESDSLAVSQISLLRRKFAGPVLNMMLALAKARKKAFGPKGKWEGSRMAREQFWAVPEALEQATDVLVARHKAAQFQAAGLWAAVIDVCCGIGGDTLALADVAPVVGVEISPVRAWMAQQNLAASAPRHPACIVRADAAQLPVGPNMGEAGGGGGRRIALHVDPARRAHGRRSAHWADLIPGPDVLLRLLRQFPDAAIKLSSAVDFDDLPAGHLELISRRGVAVQAVLWTGALAAPLGATGRTATVLNEHGGAHFSITGAPETAAAPVTPLAYVYEVDAAVHRAGLAPKLARAHGCQPINDDGGYLTSPELVRHPTLTAFEVLAQCPCKEEQISHALAQLSHDVTSERGVEVKVRGALNVDTDAVQRRLQKVARGRYTVLMYQAKTHYRALVAGRIRAD